MTPGTTRPTSGELGRVLRICSSIEWAMARYYRLLAEIHEGDDGMVRLWSKTAHEEENHGKQFELAVSIRAGIDEITITAEQATRLLQVIEDVLDEARRTQPKPVPALELSIAMEERLADFHLNSSATFVDPQLRRLFEAMMAADRNHVAALTDALRSRRG